MPTISLEIERFGGYCKMRYRMVFNNPPHAPRESEWITLAHQENKENENINVHKSAFSLSAE